MILSIIEHHSIVSTAKRSYYKLSTIIVAATIRELVLIVSLRSLCKCSHSTGGSWRHLAKRSFRFVPLFLFLANSTRDTLLKYPVCFVLRCCGKSEHYSVNSIRRNRDPNELNAFRLLTVQVYTLYTLYTAGMPPISFYSILLRSTSLCSAGGPANCHRLAVSNENVSRMRNRANLTGTVLLAKGNRRESRLSRAG